MRLQPELASCIDRIQPEFRPPNCLVAIAMELAMMAATEGYGELVADFAAERALLGEAQMMRI
jgi:hypothetical protein